MAGGVRALGGLAALLAADAAWAAGETQKQRLDGLLSDLLVLCGLMLGAILVWFSYRYKCRRDLFRTRVELRTLRENLDQTERLALLGNWEWDMISNRGTWSNELRRIFGLERESDSPSFRKVLEQVHPDDRDELRNAVLALFNESKGFTVDHRILRADGERVVRSHADVLLDKKGRPLRVVGTTQDITKQVRAEAALREVVGATGGALGGQDFFKRLVRNLASALGTRYALIGTTVGGSRVETIAFWKGDRLGRNFIYEMTGTPSEQVIGRKICAYTNRMRERFPADRELEQMEVESYIGVPLFDSMGAPVGLLAVMDVKPLKNVELASSILNIFANRASAELERMRADEALRDSESRFRLLFEQSPYSIQIYSAEGRALRVNRAWERLWELKLQDLQNYSILEDEQLQTLGIMSAVRRGFAGEAVAIPEIEYDPNKSAGIDAAGRARWISAFIYPVKNSKEEVREVVVVHLDVTDRRRAETERRRLEGRIQHAQKLESLGVLAGGIAHDFNNLLAAILGYTNLALQAIVSDSPVHGKLKRIEESALRAAELTNQMLAYAGKRRCVIEPVDLSQLVEEMGHLLEVSISKDVEFNTRYEIGLPLIEADATQIRQVVMNLLTNASESMDGRQGGVWIRTGVMKAERGYLAQCVFDDELENGDYVYVEVSDDGCGMDEETRSRIFDPFFTTKFTGRGLGLAAVLGIVRAHRGAIRLTSAPGEGTTFRVLFPPANYATDPTPRSGGSVEAGRHEGARVLCVDDEPEVLEVTRMILEENGLQVVTATDGMDAVEAFKRSQERIDLVLMDMTMPRMSGADAFLELRRLDEGVPVILTSGYSEVDAAARFADKGLTAFLQKPYAAVALMQKIRSTLREAEKAPRGAAQDA